IRVRQRIALFLAVQDASVQGGDAQVRIELKRCLVILQGLFRALPPLVSQRTIVKAAGYFRRLLRQGRARCESKDRVLVLAQAVRTDALIESRPKSALLEFDRFL